MVIIALAPTPSLSPNMRLLAHTQSQKEREKLAKALPFYFFFAIRLTQPSFLDLYSQYMEYLLSKGGPFTAFFYPTTHELQAQKALHVSNKYIM